MSYRTIIVHADESRHAPQRIRFASGLAREYGAHLLGVAAIGVSREVFPHGYHALPGSLEASCFDPLHESARRALDRFGALAIEAGVAFEQRLVADHSQFRELILGGVTRHVLQNASMPVLMAR